MYLSILEKNILQKEKQLKMDKVIEVLKAVSDPTRLRIIMALMGGKEVCVCKITEMLCLAPSTISKHMSILKHAGLIESRKEGKWIYYKIDISKSNKNFDFIDLIYTKLSDDKIIKRDNKNICKLCAE